MPRGHGRGFSRPGKTIDFKAWDAIPGALQNLSANGTTAPAGISFTGPQTILRSRGEILLQMDENTLAADNALIAMALGIMSTDAFAAGGASLPDPSGNADYPWLWWQTINLATNFTLAAGSDQVAGMTTRVVQVDSKAMRRVKPNETLSLVFQYVNVSGNPTIQVDAGLIRVLFGT